MHIVYYPDPVLLNPAAEVTSVPENIDEIVAGMREVMELEKGIGIAAPQVGLGQKIILIGKIEDESEEERILLNPEIIRTSTKKEWGEEGCLSFPGIYGDVLRHLEIEVRYTDLNGEEQVLVATDFLARVLQHEIDHLNGRIFVEMMRPADKILNKKRMQELVERFEAGA